MRKILRTWKIGFILVYSLLVSAQIDNNDSANLIEDFPNSDFGLTAYGESCSDDCKQRGFPYTWCHKTPSRSGTWIDRDYCSPTPGVTRYLEPCLDACTKKDEPFYWCKTRPTKRGDWDYCSPQGSVGQVCFWSAWESWSECSLSCGAKSVRTRRRRFETESGKVGHCSGEIEQNISKCHVGECPAPGRPRDCSWSDWGSWSSCSTTCGPVSGQQHRTRKIETKSASGGLPCIEEEGYETILCSTDDECPQSENEDDVTESDKFIEEPRSINADNRGKLQSNLFTEKGKEKPDEFPFTVVRVSSTVSHVRPKTDEENFETTTTTTDATTTTDTTTTMDTTTSTDTTTSMDTSTTTDKTTTTEIVSKIVKETLKDDLPIGKGSKPPYLRPLTKFPDIKIPSFGSTTTSVTQSPITFSPKIRLSILSQKPFVPTTTNKPVTIQATTSQTSSSIRSDSSSATTLTTTIASSTAAVQSGISETTPSPTSSSNVTATDNDSSVETTTATTPLALSSTEQNNVKIMSSVDSTIAESSSSIAESNTSDETTNNPSQENETVTDSQQFTTEETLLVESKKMEESNVTKESSDKIAETSPVTGSPLIESKNNSEVNVTTETTSAVTKSIEEGNVITLAVSKSTDESSTTPSAVTNTTDESIVTTVASLIPVTTVTDSINTTGSTITEGNKSNDNQTEISLVATKKIIETLKRKCQDKNCDETTSLPDAEEDLESDNFIPETTPHSSTTEAKSSNKTIGRAGSRFKDLGDLRELFAKRRNRTSAVQRTTEIFFTTPSSTVEESSRSRPIFSNRFRNKVSESSSAASSDKSEPTEVTNSNPLIRRRPIFKNRFQPSENTTTTTTSPEVSLTEASEEKSATTVSETAPSSTGRIRQSFLNKFRTTTDTPFSTPNLPTEQTTEVTTPKLETEITTSSQVDPTQRPLSFFRTKGTRKPLIHSRTTRTPTVASDSSENSNKIQLTSLDKEVNKNKPDLINQFYPDYDEDGSKEETTTFGSVTSKSSPNDFDDDDSTEPFFVTPLPADIAYNPCALSDACGPNAICESLNGVDHVCHCPPGFSGIPREGLPDPAHGCVRTPEKCSNVTNDCSSGTVCVRNYCLPMCKIDLECSLGERCVDGACIKICFYDAHCLAGEFCEKSDENEGNGVCLSGCRRDTNCPFGQVCRDNRCENGCHFNNDCTQSTACINGTCSDPCADFHECGSHAICQVVSHAPTCSCPQGLKELNSPYDACIPENINLSELECLRHTDCQAGFTCEDWHCTKSR